mmetsp:Transcript_99531/g.281908  ORF Transcript_99531/g.281908 Transcript_99531/m.281908 type:complete len:401 (-) Transcript_99531:863-2065(-)
MELGRRMPRDASFRHSDSLFKVLDPQEAEAQGHPGGLVVGVHEQALPEPLHSLELLVDLHQPEALKVNRVCIRGQECQGLLEAVVVNPVDPHGIRLRVQQGHPPLNKGERRGRQRRLRRLHTEHLPGMAQHPLGPTPIPGEFLCTKSGDNVSGQDGPALVSPLHSLHAQLLAAEELEDEAAYCRVDLGPVVAAHGCSGHLRSAHDAVPQLAPGDLVHGPRRELPVAPQPLDRKAGSEYPSLVLSRRPLLPQGVAHSHRPVVILAVQCCRLGCAASLRDEHRAFTSPPVSPLLVKIILLKSHQCVHLSLLLQQFQFLVEPSLDVRRSDQELLQDVIQFGNLGQHDTCRATPVAELQDHSVGHGQLEGLEYSRMQVWIVFTVEALLARHDVAVAEIIDGVIE